MTHLIWKPFSKRSMTRRLIVKLPSIYKLYIMDTGTYTCNVMLITRISFPFPRIPVRNQ